MARNLRVSDMSPVDVTHHAEGTPHPPAEKSDFSHAPPGNAAHFFIPVAMRRQWRSLWARPGLPRPVRQGGTPSLTGR